VHRRRLPAVALALALATAACGGAARPATGAAPSGIVATQPAAAVEQFLGFATQGRYVEMGHLFGTVRGPVAEQQEAVRVARRMEALAMVLRHDSYTLTGVVSVAGRPEARRVLVQLRQGRQTVDVPFVVVQAAGGRWLVEVVGVEAAMEPNRRP
jgi:hypothetical protein